jgi:hypothetical protein
MRAAALVAVLALSVGVVACGGDDGDSAAAGATSSSTSSTTMAMGMQENPCGPGGSGELPNMTLMTPSDGATPVTITATEYSFAGTDALEAGGAFAVTFVNDGKELHELHVARLADGEERPMEAILEDPMAEQSTASVGHSFACPGETAEAAGVNLTEPGRYIVLCFIPTGATADTDPAQFDSLGMPHAMNGMAVEIDIA